MSKTQVVYHAATALVAAVCSFSTLGCSANSGEALESLGHRSSALDDGGAWVLRPIEFDINVSASSIQIGSKTFPVGEGSLMGSLAPEDSTGTCQVQIDAVKSNPTFQKVRVVPFPSVDAQLELCNDMSGNIEDTLDGSARLAMKPVGVKLKLSGTVNCEVPCTPTTFASGPSLAGRDYSPVDGTVTVVDDQFALAGSTCNALVNLAMGLPSAAGKNVARLSLKALGAPPTCALGVDASAGTTP